MRRLTAVHTSFWASILLAASLPAAAQSSPIRSAITGITLPGPAKPVGGTALSPITSQLNSAARGNKLSGKCQTTEAFTLDLDSDDSVEALESSLTRAGYAVTELASASDDGVTFSLKKGQQTVVANISFGDSGATLAWCALGTAAAAATPAKPQTQAQATQSKPPSAATSAPTPKTPPATAPKASPAPAQGTGAKTAPAAQAIDPLSGLYFRVRTYATSTSEEYFFFPGDGRVVFEMPEGGLDPVDRAWLARVQREHPDRVAAYRIAGGRISFTTPGKPAHTESFVRGPDANLTIGGLFTKRVDRFPNGTRLEATYSYAGVASGNGTSVSTGFTLVLHADGTFTSRGLAGVSATAGGQTQLARAGSESAGRYQLSGNTLVLNHADGKVTRHTVFPYYLGEKVGNPRFLYFDGIQMSLAR